MRRTLTAAVLGIAVLAGGCGSSSTPTPTVPPSHIPTTTTPIATTGNAGNVLSNSGRYNATNSTVRAHINAALVKYFTAKDFSGVTVVCKALSAARVSCQATGTNRKGQTSSAKLTVSVSQSNGLLKIVHVAS